MGTEIVGKKRKKEMNEETTKLCIYCHNPIIRKEYESNRDFNRTRNY